MLQLLAQTVGAGTFDLLETDVRGALNVPDSLAQSDVGVEFQLLVHDAVVYLDLVEPLFRLRAKYLYGPARVSYSEVSKSFGVLEAK